MGLQDDYYLEITGKIELFTIARRINALRNIKNNGGKFDYSDGSDKNQRIRLLIFIKNSVR